jgi:anti-sigma B factor antagonist
MLDTMSTEQISLEERDGVLVVTVAGRLDITNSETFELSVLDRFSSKRLPVVVRMSGVSYMSSSGVRALLAIYHALRKHGKSLIITELSTAVQKIISVTELDRVFPVVEGLENALQRATAN